METKRTKTFGRKKEDLPNKDLYTYEEALQVLGPCSKKRKFVWTEEEEYRPEEPYESCIWEGPILIPIEGVHPEGWYKTGKEEIIEKYDVWENNRGEFVLAKIPNDKKPNK